MSVATGISPNELLNCDPALYSAIKFILTEQSNSRRAMQGGKRRR